jgi:acetyltransferase-like isoleucine patch superfamily enzyme
VGKHVFILPNVTINHDCIIGDYTCIGAGASISGGVKVGQSCYLGANSSIIGNAKIGDYCLIGLGSVVLHDTEECAVIAGNPARFLRSIFQSSL